MEQLVDDDGVASYVAGVERNPGPGATTDCFNARSIVNQQRSAVRLGSLNAGGATATTKAAIIDDLIRDNRLDILAVCESWILDDAPDAIKYDIAPDNYSVLHVHRQRSSKKDSQSEVGVWHSFTTTSFLSSQSRAASSPRRSSCNWSVSKSATLLSKSQTSTDHPGCLKAPS